MVDRVELPPGVRSAPTFAPLSRGVTQQHDIRIDALALEASSKSTEELRRRAIHGVHARCEREDVDDNGDVCRGESHYGNWSPSHRHIQVF